MMYYRRTIVQTAAISSALLFRSGAAASNPVHELADLAGASELSKSGSSTWTSRSAHEFDGKRGYRNLANHVANPQCHRNLEPIVLFSKETGDKILRSPEAFNPLATDDADPLGPSHDEKNPEEEDTAVEGSMSRSADPHFTESDMEIQPNPVLDCDVFNNNLDDQTKDLFKWFMKKRYPFGSRFQPEYITQHTKNYINEIIYCVWPFVTPYIREKLIKMDTQKVWDFNFLVRVAKVHEDHFGEVSLWNDTPYDLQRNRFNRIRMYLKKWETGTCGGKILHEAPEEDGWCMSTLKSTAECLNLVKKEPRSFTDHWETFDQEEKREIYEYCRTGIISAETHQESAFKDADLLKFRKIAYETFKLDDYNLQESITEDQWMGFKPLQRVREMCWMPSCHLVQASQFERLLTNEEVQQYGVDFRPEGPSEASCCAKCIADFIDRLCFNTAK